VRPVRSGRRRATLVERSEHAGRADRHLVNVAAMGPYKGSRDRPRL
jgi:hypothetical protein